MDYFRGVLGKGLAFLLVFFGDHRENVIQFCQSVFARVHQGETAENGGDFSHPSAVFLPVEHDFVVLQRHVFAAALPNWLRWRPSKLSTLIVAQTSARA